MTSTQRGNFFFVLSKTEQYEQVDFHWTKYSYAHE